MGLFRRVGDILTANLNEMVERFEDPETMLKQAIREMEVALADSLDHAAKVVASAKLLKQQIVEHERQVEHWQRAAERAASTGDDRSARQALTRKLEGTRLLASLRDESSAVSASSQKLRRRVDAMRIKIAEAKRKLATLAASRRAVQIRQRLSSRCSCLSVDGAAFVRFERLQQQVDQAQAEADAFEEISDSWLDPTAASRDEEFQATIEAELAALKVRTAQGE